MYARVCRFVYRVTFLVGCIILWTFGGFMIGVRRGFHLGVKGQGEDRCDSPCADYERYVEHAYRCAFKCVACGHAVVEVSDNVEKKD
jgi:hypothetical protein